MLHEKTRDLEAKDKELAWLKDPRVQVALLKGLEGNPTARAKLLWHPGHEAGNPLGERPPAAAAREELRAVGVRRRPARPAGTFDAQSDGATVIPISKQESLGEAPVKFAVSVEPKGGVPAPTGAIVLVGERF